MGIFINTFLTSLLLFSSLLLARANDEDDPYDVLGVKRSASQREIQKAYHRMSRLHHPDKNRKDPAANEKFQKINIAYETLSDPEKRKQYDTFGHTRGHDGGGFHSPGSFFHHGGGFGDPFDFMFSNFGGHGGGASTDSMRVTRRVVEMKLMPESVTRPTLILAKAHFCFQCGPISQLWSRVADELSSYGVNMATAYLDEPGGMAEFLRLSTVPAIIGISNRRIYNYASYESSGQISVSSLISFLRKMLPPNLVDRVNPDSDLKFDDGRVRVILGYSAPRPDSPPPLRFALAAFRNRLQAKFVSLRLDERRNDVTRKLDLPFSGETVSVLDENFEKNGPVYRKIANRELSSATIDAVVAKKGFLSLPRIFSTPMLNTLCPAESETDADSTRELTLCVVLIVDKRSPRPLVIDQFREFSEMFRRQQAHQIAYQLRFAYFLSSVQTGFASALRQYRSGQRFGDSVLDVAIFKQREPGQVTYDYWEDAWNTDNEVESRNQLSAKLMNFRNQRRLPHFSRIPELLDENRESLLQRIWWRLQDWADRLQYSVSNSDTPMFYVTVLCTMMVGVGSILLSSILSAVRGMMSPSSNMDFSDDHTSNVNGRHPQAESNRMLNVQLFCGETCDRLVKNLPRGEISIVLLTTQELQAGLLQAFVDAIRPYTRYHRLHFAFMDLDLPENPRWYQALLESSLGHEVDIEWRRCSGTVLAFNGYRDYYCLFHPAYKSLSTVGRFAGLDDDDEATVAASAMVGGLSNGKDPKRMMQRLPQWLDCLLEGTLKRFKLEVWPNMAEIVEELHSGNSAGAAS